jgi:cold shock CspA family protein
MPKGVITYWNSARAFGFIANRDGGPPVFLHISGLAEFLHSTEAIWPGMVVEFDIAAGPDHKTRAVNTRVLEAPETQSGEVKSERLKRQG